MACQSLREATSVLGCVLGCAGSGTRLEEVGIDEEALLRHELDARQKVREAHYGRRASMGLLPTSDRLYP